MIGYICIVPYFERGYFTLIHKLSINWFNLKYINSQIIPWKPINQYSMDEDSNWNFRIFTKYDFPKRATDLYIFNQNLNLEWKLTNIAPGEQFKSSRFIEDKAYLVTFKATDPLFVIDLKDNKNPKIIWELKIPGYSLYLHPLEKTGSIQYLLWIWQEAEEIHWNWSLPKNIKLDIYKIDYSKKTKDNKILVEQIHSKILWLEEKVGNWWSYTPVFNNPRTFVLFKNKNTKILLLPVYLAKDKLEKRCQVWWENKNCYEFYSKVPYFVWVKGFKINLNSGFEEILSKNYLSLYQKAKINLNHRKYRIKDHRVAYYTDNKTFATIAINNDFFDIFTSQKNKLIAFNPKLWLINFSKTQTNPAKECLYNPPQPGTITCQMYCGKRWILDKKTNSCKQIEINAACVCPWFDTKDECEKYCLNR